MKNLFKMMQFAFIFAVAFTEQETLSIIRKDKKTLAKSTPVTQKTDDTKDIQQTEYQGYPSATTPVPTVSPATSVQSTLVLYENAASSLNQLWNAYREAPILANGFFEESKYQDIMNKFIALNNAIAELKDPQLASAYYTVYINFTTLDANHLYNKQITAQSLKNLLDAINQAAPGRLNWQIKDIDRYIVSAQPMQQVTTAAEKKLVIPTQVSPTLAGVGALGSAYYSWTQPARDFYSSIKNAISSGWQTSKEWANYLRQLVWTYKEEESDAETRLATLQGLRDKQKSGISLSKEDTELLKTLEQFEAQDKAIVTKWFRYLVGGAGVAGLAYKYPEAAKYIATSKPLYGAVGAYAGYKLLQPEQQPSTPTTQTNKPQQ